MTAEVISASTTQQSPHRERQCLLIQQVLPIQDIAVTENSSKLIHFCDYLRNTYIPILNQWIHTCTDEKVSHSYVL